MDKQCRDYALKKMQEKKESKLEKYAAGGAAKVRQGAATSAGNQIKTSPQKGK